MLLKITWESILLMENIMSINHISSDLEGHQVQERNFQFGTIS